MNEELRKYIEENYTPEESPIKNVHRWISKHNKIDYNELYDVIIQIHKANKKIEC